MPLSFPSNPSVNQTSTQNGRVYVWSGSALSSTERDLAEAYLISKWGIS